MVMMEEEMYLWGRGEGGIMVIEANGARRSERVGYKFLKMTAS